MIKLVEQIFYILEALGVATFILAGIHAVKWIIETRTYNHHSHEKDIYALSAFGFGVLAVLCFVLQGVMLYIDHSMLFGPK